MNEISGKCLACRATITLPMPDMWETPDGDMIDAGRTDEDAEAMMEFLHDLPCPKCGSKQIRVTLPR